MEFKKKRPASYLFIETDFYKLNFFLNVLFIKPEPSLKEKNWEKTINGQ